MKRRKATRNLFASFLFFCTTSILIVKEEPEMAETNKQTKKVRICYLGIEFGV